MQEHAKNRMAIVIKQTGPDYEALATPPHTAGPAWHTPHPMPARELIAALLERGCHQTDVGDALHAANPNGLADAQAQRS